jgi:hypothetical protein
MEQAELAALHARAEAALTKIPGVAGVGFGHKEKDGRTTDELSLRVYVRVKKPLSELKPDEVIPPEFEGIPTDVVLVIEDIPLHCEDLIEHDPLVSGISVLNAYDELGTLGFFATINGDDGWDNVVLVSNYHVISAFGAKRGDRVFQPKLVRQADGTPKLADPEKKNPIAKMHKVGMEGIHPYTFPGPGEAEFDAYLDCATARLDICVSSWCHTNCGVSYKSEIDRLALGGSSKIADMGRVAQADIGTDKAIVYKTGRKTGHTKGRVVDPLGSRIGPGKVIIIEPEGLDCDGIDRFADGGDSGSAIVTADRKLIGLLYARSGANPRQILASHIQPVLEYLDITAITEANPPVPPAGKILLDRQGSFGDFLNDTQDLRARLLATEAGGRLYAKALDHRLEVIELVNHCRPVTVAWHRGKGPAFLNRAINNLRSPEEAIPRRIDGVGRTQLLERMREALHAHGSAALRAALDAHAGEIIALCEMFDDLRDLAERFENEARAGEEMSLGAG